MITSSEHVNKVVLAKLLAKLWYALDIICTKELTVVDRSSDILNTLETCEGGVVFINNANNLNLTIVTQILGNKDPELNNICDWHLHITQYKNEAIAAFIIKELDDWNWMRR